MYMKAAVYLHVHVHVHCILLWVTHCSLFNTAAPTKWSRNLHTCVGLKSACGQWTIKVSSCDSLHNHPHSQTTTSPPPPSPPPPPFTSNRHQTQHHMSAGLSMTPPACCCPASHTATRPGHATGWDDGYHVAFGGQPDAGTCGKDKNKCTHVHDGPQGSTLWALWATCSEGPVVDGTYWPPQGKVICMTHSMHFINSIMLYTCTFTH